MLTDSLIVFKGPVCIIREKGSNLAHNFIPNFVKVTFFIFFDFDKVKGPNGFPILTWTDGRTPLNIFSQALSRPTIPTGRRCVFAVAERKAAPFFAGRSTRDREVPSGKTPKTSPFFSARIEFLMVEGAKLVRSVGINPYKKGAQINCASITWSLAAKKLIGFWSACITKGGSI